MFVIALALACGAPSIHRTKELHNLRNFILWSTIMMHYRNMTTMLTREYLDARPNGWLDYAPLRIAQQGIKGCTNKTLCKENLNILLLTKPSIHPQQICTSIIVGNFGDLLKTKFGEEIDYH
ncbi:Sialyltransferase-like protein 1, partial [Mucuna pruriens]